MVITGFFALLVFNAAVSAIRAEIKSEEITIPKTKVFRTDSKPDSQEKINVDFILYNSDKPNGKVITTESIPDGVTGRNRTIFVVHGFRSNCEAKWMSDMEKKLRARDNVNVILVDWREGADLFPVFYRQAARNVQTAGHDIAGMMDALKKIDIEYSSMWCIGHSLGAHTCGHAGRNITKYGTNKIGRITGLDPAGPCFRHEPAPNSLKEDDANFVDVIHTNGGKANSFKLGKLAPMGTLDFYPNKGKKQPGCGVFYDQNQNMAKKDCPGENETLPCGPNEDTYGGKTCSHARAHVYFRNSINESACSFKAEQRCTNHSIIPDSCSKNADQAQMGYYAKSSQHGIYYLDVELLGSQCYKENGVGNKTPSMYLFLWATVAITNLLV